MHPPQIVEDDGNGGRIFANFKEGLGERQARRVVAGIEP
jgi:hypothetical protein